MEAFKSVRHDVNASAGSLEVMGMDEWKCRICDTENPAEEEICHECGAYRYEEAYNAISDEEDETE